MPRRVRHRLILAITLLILAASFRLGAQQMSVGADIQVSMYMRILSFDRTLAVPGEKPVVIGVLHQADVRSSLLASEEFISAATAGAEKHILSRPVVVMPVVYNGIDSLRQFLATNHVEVLYLCPLRAVDVSLLCEVATALGCRTITGVPEYNEKGVAIGIGTRAGHPSILVNLRQARAQGMDLSAQLLKLARIVE